MSQHQDRGNKPTKTTRAAIYARDDHRCCYCGCDVHPGADTTDPQAATLDHLVPFSQGGTWEARNLVTACFACNRARGDAKLLDWLRAACALCGLAALAPTFSRRIHAQARKGI